MCQVRRKACKAVYPATAKKSVIAGNAKANSYELKERSLNVYEKKGSLWKTRERSLNVYENAGA
jgi:hypothetical protein